MHPLSGGGGYQPPTSVGGYAAAQSPSDAGGSPQDGTGAGVAGGGGGGGQPHYSDINQILDQILNITDQSLDEAQVRLARVCRVQVEERDEEYAAASQ